MDTQKNNVTPGKKFIETDDPMKNLVEVPVGNKVLPDECGDTLWDEVLAQNDSLTTLLNKPMDIVQNVAAAVLECNATNAK